MSEYTVTSRCECQALLGARLDAKRHVLSGWSIRDGVRETAPAHSIGAGPEVDRFDLGWACTHCGRNVLRAIYAGSLRPVAAPRTTP